MTRHVMHAGILLKGLPVLCQEGCIAFATFINVYSPRKKQAVLTGSGTEARLTRKDAEQCWSSDNKDLELAQQITCHNFSNAQHQGFFKSVVAVDVALELSSDLAP